MLPVLILGAGKIGASIAKLLSRAAGFEVTVADRDAAALERLAAATPVRTRVLEIAGAEPLAEAIREVARGRVAAVRLACSFDVNPVIAGASYFDLTEDVVTTRRVRALAARAIERQVFVPQCGLVPGFIGILAAGMCRRFGRIDTVAMRVGALPKFPHNHMKYNLTWSTDGVINEYCNPCEVLHHGRRSPSCPKSGSDSGRRRLGPPGAGSRRSKERSLLLTNSLENRVFGSTSGRSDARGLLQPCGKGIALRHIGSTFLFPIRMA